MPYTIDELKKNAYYQHLHVADEIEYQNKLIEEGMKKF